MSICKQSIPIGDHVVEHRVTGPALLVVTLAPDLKHDDAAERKEHHDHHKDCCAAVGLEGVVRVAASNPNPGCAFRANRWLGVQEIAVGQKWVTGIRGHFDDVCAVGVGRPRERRLEGPGISIVIVQRQDFGGTFEEDPDVGILERRGKAGGPAENDPRVS